MTGVEEIMVTGTRKCMHCGKELTRQQVWRNGKYCSRECFDNSHWGEPIQFGKILTRSKAFIEAAKLCQTGLTQADAAKLLGLRPYLVSKWFVLYGTDAILQNRVCAHCGKALNGMKYRSNRKYCSRSCKDKADYARKHPDSALMKFDPELRANALELYWGGLEGTLIARHLGVAAGTVYCWIHNFGHLRKRCLNSNTFALLSVRYQLIEAKCPEEWQKILRECAPEGEVATIVLVCGVYYGKGEINHLASIISDRLKRDPRDGKTYAFCSCRYELASTICWRGSAFCFTKLPKSQGKYIWPDVSVGQQIEVHQNEFEYLLSLQKKRGPKPYFS